MDFAAILAAAPGLGVGGTLFALVMYLLRSSHTERIEYRKAIAEEELRNSEQLAAERKIADDLRARLEEERRKRFDAEEEASRLRRGSTL